MHLDPVSGLWKSDDNDYKPPFRKKYEDDDESDEETSDVKTKPSVINGKCILSIRFENHGEYLRWKKYSGDRKWDFLVNYPAILRAEYEFNNSLDVEMMTKKIIQLLQMGFDVYSANWQVKEKIANETTP